MFFHALLDDAVWNRQNAVHEKREGVELLRMLHWFDRTSFRRDLSVNDCLNPSHKRAEIQKVVRVGLPKTLQGIR